MKDQHSRRIGMYWTLRRFIEGENDRELEMDFAMPVIMLFTNKNTTEPINLSSQVDMTMSFYVPKVNHEDTPRPVNTQVTVSDLLDFEVAAIRFSGWAQTSDYLHHRDRLVKNLGTDAKLYDQVNMVTAGYDSPFNLFDRRNEVWLRKL